VNNGFNPMRWVCSERGCYNTKHRPKIEIFAECLPGRIALTDIDATVEVNGHFLFLEFKSPTIRELPTGQRIYFERLTALSDKIVVVVVFADAENMACRAIRTIHAGKTSEIEICSIDGLKERLRKWANKAVARKRAA
jgi:hypothetical protein